MPRLSQLRRFSRQPPANQEIRDVRDDLLAVGVKRGRCIMVGTISDATDLQETKAVERGDSCATTPLPSYAEGVSGFPQFLGPREIDNVFIATGDGPEMCAESKTACLCDFAKLVQQSGIGIMAWCVSAHEADLIVVLDSARSDDDVPESAAGSERPSGADAQESSEPFAAVNQVLALNCELRLSMATDCRDHREGLDIETQHGSDTPGSRRMTAALERVQERPKLVGLRHGDQYASHNQRSSSASRA
jgi:hypothetical protein